LHCNNLLDMNNLGLLSILDGILFFFVALTVLYILFFSIASLFYHHADVGKAKRQNRFIVLIPAYKRDDVILQSVNSVLGQTYPQRQFDIVVISDHEKEMTNMRLAQLPITLLTPDFDESSKAKSLQYAILNLPQFKIYDAVLVLDADNIIEPEFLDQANDAFESAGTKAIQAHRMARNRDTSIARLDSIFEEINTSIFRRGQNAIGMSAALNGSGMIYDFEWFKSHIMKVSPQGEDKHFEAMLLRESIYIDFFDNLYIFDEKTRTTKDFNRQRARWTATQLHALINNIHNLPSAIFGHRYDYANKIIQWILIPRTIMMGIIMVMGTLMPFHHFSAAIKWWIAAATLLFAFSLATPNRFVDKNWNKDFLHVPWLILYGLANIIRIGIMELNVRLAPVKKKVQRSVQKKKRKA